MSNDVVIGASMRANLLSLQRTNSLLDATQYKLSTGRKVNSALDDPQSFFAAQSLTNRANDLSRLLDAMGQSIQTIKEADKGITALTRLVEQADAVAKKAKDAINTGGQEAKIVGGSNLLGLKDLPTDFGATANSTITFTVTDPDDPSTPALNAQSVTIAAGDSIDQLVTKINDLADADGNQVLEAKLNDKGQLEIKALNGGKAQLVFEDAGAGADDAADMRLASALGFSGMARTVASGAGGADPNQTAVTLSDTASLVSFGFHDATSATGDIAKRTTTLVNVEDADGNALFTRSNDGGKIQIGINGGSLQNVIADLATTTTVQDLIDSINGNSQLSAKIEASYDEATGQVSIRSLDASVASIEVAVVNDADSAVSANFGFGMGALAPAASSTATESIRLGAAAGELATLERDFNTLRDQIDNLVEDTGYRGVNLLKGDVLLTVFNETRSTSLMTVGSTFTSVGLGLSAANFSSDSAVETMLDEVRAALGSVRSFGTMIANDLAIIQTREDFTKETITNLTEGADKLTIADPNEEGARMLALQTRLQLGVTSLSLASQSSQSVLRLFG